MWETLGLVWSWGSDGCGVGDSVPQGYVNQQDQPLSSVKCGSVPSSDWGVPWKIVLES